MCSVNIKSSSDGSERNSPTILGLYVNGVTDSKSNETMYEFIELKRIFRCNLSAEEAQHLMRAYPSIFRVDACRETVAGVPVSISAGSARFRLIVSVIWIEIQFC